MEGITLSDIKTVMELARDRHTDQRNRIENPDIASHKYGQLILTKV